MYSNAAQEKLPINYFLLVFVISVPIWWIGGNKLPIPIDLPVSSLMSFCPLIAALILFYREYGLSGMKELLKKTVDYKKIRNKLWYGPIL
jgi:hypothetical protein